MAVNHGEFLAYQLKQLQASGLEQAAMAERLEQLVALERTGALSRYGLSRDNSQLDTMTDNVVALPLTIVRE